MHKIHVAVLGDVWKQFLKAAQCCGMPIIRGILPQLSGKVGQMLRVKEAPVGPSERWFGGERGEDRQEGQASPFIQPHPKQKATAFWS